MTTTSTGTSTLSRLNPGRSLAAIVMIAVLLGGGWYAYLSRIPRPESAADFRPDPGARGRGGGIFGGQRGNAPMVAPRQREPVTVQPRIVTIRDDEMTISSQLRADSNWNIFIAFRGESLGGADAQRLFLAVRRTVEAKQPPDSLKLTAQQRAALAAIPLTPLELSPEQHKELVDLLNQTQKLAANPPEMAPVKARLQGLAAQIKTVDRVSTKAKYAERDAKFRSILSAEQIETLLGARNIRNNNGAPPAANPAV